MISRLAIGAAALLAGVGAAVAVNETLLSGCTSTTRPVVTPGQSWQAAYLAAGSCDRIPLGAGNHGTQRLSFDATKTIEDDVVFEGAGVVVNQFLTGRYNVAGDAAKHFELRGLTIRDVQIDRDAEDVTLRDLSMDKFFIRAASNVSIIGGEVGPWTNDVATIFGCAGCTPPRDILIDSVVFHDFLISDPAKHAECVQIWPSGASNITVRNSIFRNCTDFGILVKETGNSGIVIERSFFEAPMPGNVATTTCSPNCPRGGNSIRFSGVSETWPGSAIRDNIVNGGIGVDCNCIPRTNNVAGVIPEVPPGATPPADSLPVSVIAQDATTVTLGWTAVRGLGYRFSVDAKIISLTWDANRASVKFAKKPGAVFAVESLQAGPRGTVVSP